MQMAKNRIFSALLTLLMLVAVLPINGYAIDPIDLEAKTSLTMVFCPDDRAAEGSEFQIWRVGEPDRFCNFTKTETFAPYDVAVGDLTAEGWADLAVTLAGYAARDKIAPDATAVVDEDGNAVFSDLPTGLYLVQEVRVDNTAEINSLITDNSLGLGGAAAGFRAIGLGLNSQLVI